MLQYCSPLEIPGRDIPIDAIPISSLPDRINVDGQYEASVRDAVATFTSTARRFEGVVRFSR
jgi:hypothetical protein